MARNAWSFSASPMPTTLCGDSPLSSSAAASPLALFDARRQHHHRALVEHDVQLEAELAHRLQHDVLHRLPGGDDAAADRQRLHAALAQARDELLGRRRGEHGLAAGAGLVEQRAVLGHDQIATAELGKHAFQIGQLAAGDQDQAPPRVLEPPDRRHGVGIDHAVMGERAVVIGGKGQKVQRLVSGARWAAGGITSRQAERFRCRRSRVAAAGAAEHGPGDPLSPARRRRNPSGLTPPRRAAQ